MPLLSLFRPLWSFRLFIVAAVAAEFRNRFARSRLGALWHVLQPLAQAAIFAVVLAEVLGSRLPGVAAKGAYAFYLLAGMAAWGLFSEVLNRCLTVFIEYSDMMKRILFPRLALPAIVWGSALINHIILLVATMAVLAVMGHPPSLTWLGVIPGILVISVLAFGFGVLLGVINIFSRDVSQAMTVVMQLWFWMTPVVYSLDVLPPRVQMVVGWNPMTPLVRVYQDSIAFGRWPDFSTLLWPASLAAVFCVLAFVVFQRASAEIVDVL